VHRPGCFYNISEHQYQAKISDRIQKFLGTTDHAKFFDYTAGGKTHSGIAVIDRKSPHIWTYTEKKTLNTLQKMRRIFCGNNDGTQTRPSESGLGPRDVQQIKGWGEGVKELKNMQLVGYQPAAGLDHLPRGWGALHPSEKPCRRVQFRTLVVIPAGITHRQICCMW